MKRDALKQGLQVTLAAAMVVLLVFLWAAVEKARDWEIVYEGEFSPDGRSFLRVSDRGMFLYATDTGRVQARLGKGEYVEAVFSSDGQRLAAGGHNGKITVWDTRDYRVVSDFIAHEGRVMDLRFAAGAEVIVSTDGDEVRSWQSRTGQRLVTFDSPQRVDKLAVSADGRTLAGGGGGDHASDTHTIFLWHMDSGALRSRWPGPGNTYVRGLRFLPDKKTLLTWLSDRLYYWDIQTGSTTRMVSLSGRDSLWDSRLAFSPDGRLLAVGGDFTRVLDLQSRQEVAMLPRASGAAFVGGERTVLLTTEDGTMKEVEVPAGREVRRLVGLAPEQAHRPWMLLVAFGGWLALWVSAGRLGQKGASLGRNLVALTACYAVVNAWWMVEMTDPMARHAPTMAAALALCLLAVLLGLVMIGVAVAVRKRHGDLVCAIFNILLCVLLFVFNARVAATAGSP